MQKHDQPVQGDVLSRGSDRRVADAFGEFLDDRCIGSA